MQSNFFIFDANGNLFGNTKGYKRIQDAQRICTRKRDELHEIYTKRTRTESNTFWEIKQFN